MLEQLEINRSLMTSISTGAHEPRSVILALQKDGLLHEVPYGTPNSFVYDQHEGVYLKIEHTYPQFTYGGGRKDPPSCEPPLYMNGLTDIDKIRLNTTIQSVNIDGTFRDVNSISIELNERPPSAPDFEFKMQFSGYTRVKYFARSGDNKGPMSTYLFTLSIPVKLKFVSSSYLADLSLMPEAQSEDPGTDL